MALPIARVIQSTAFFVSLWPLCVSTNAAPKPSHFKCEPGKVGSKIFEADGSPVELLVRGPGCPDADPVVPSSLQEVPAGTAQVTNQAKVVSDRSDMHVDSASVSSPGRPAEATPSSPGRTWLVVGAIILVLALVSGLAAKLYDTKVRQPKAAAEKRQREKEEEDQKLIQVEDGQTHQEPEGTESERLRAQEEADRAAREAREASEREQRKQQEAKEREEAERKALEQEQRQRLEGEAQAREEAARLENERRAAAEAEAKAKKAEAKAKAEAEAKAQKRCAPCCGSKPAAEPSPR